jgi:MoaA/NifB/PqqE/SkfB family radical SAM enzyme
MQGLSASADGLSTGRKEEHYNSGMDAAGPRRITFITNPGDCNLACRMCREHSPLRPGPRAARRRLTGALVECVLAERAGSPLREVIPSTQGEPLLWSGLDRLIDTCAEMGLSLNVTTNGTFPGRGPEAWAERLVPVASDVKVSWNGASARTYEWIMGGARFAAALENLRRFLRRRDARRAAGARACRVSFQVTAQAENVEELPAIVRLAAGLGVERVKVNHLQVRFPELAASDLRRGREGRARWNRAVAEARRAAEEHPLASGWPVELQNLAPLPLEGEDPPFGPCPFLGREAWVTADGRFSPCPAAPGLEGRLGDLCSLEERSLGEIWRSAGYRELVAGYARRAECRRCPMRRAGGL